MEIELEPPGKKTGRPSSYTFEVSEEICRQMAEGKGLRQICAQEEMPSRPTVLRWIEDNPSFRDRYARARTHCMEWYQEEILRIAFDDSGDLIIDGDRVMSGHHVVQRARLKVDSLKWVMSKLAPKKYGDKPVDDTPQPTLTFQWLSGPDPAVQPPAPPAQLTYNPAPPPADMEPEQWSRLTSLMERFKQVAPSDSTADEFLDVFEAALRKHYLASQ
jgi:hypothetical protein